MPMFDQSVINFALYEDSIEYAGIAEVTMPSLNALIQTLSGAGIAGNVESVILGHFEAMTLGLKFRTTTEHSIKLSEPRRHTLDLRVPQQVEDSTEGTINVQALKHYFIVVPKTSNPGKVAPASQTDGSGEYAVRYWSTYIDGKKYREIDPLNFVCYIDGVDYLEPVRKALGK